MENLWLNNDLIDRLAMLQQTEVEHSGINQMAIEKDWWVTVTLKALFQTECRDFLAFKGGTSLSKGFSLVERFSEDVDLSISHSFWGIEKTNKNQRDKLRKTARKYILETLSSQLDSNLKGMGIIGYTIENATQFQDKTGSPIRHHIPPQSAVEKVHFFRVGDYRRYWSKDDRTIIQTIQNSLGNQNRKRRRTEQGCRKRKSTEDSGVCHPRESIMTKERTF